MIGRGLGLVVAALMIVGGAALTLQGLGSTEGGDRPSGGSAILGPLLAGLGVALVIVVVQGARRR